MTDSSRQRLSKWLSQPVYETFETGWPERIGTRVVRRWELVVMGCFALALALFAFLVIAPAILGVLPR